MKDGIGDVYCENCGDLIKRVYDKYDFTPPDIPKNEPKTKIATQPAKPRKIRKELKPNPDAFNFPIGRVFYDAEFPLTFKSNFIVVFSRLICASVLKLEEAGHIDLGDSDPSESVINDLYMATRIVQNKRVKSEFLTNLREISIEEFESILKKLQEKIQSNRQYMEDFHVYSRWLIRRVFCIITAYKPDEQLTIFEKTILNESHLLSFDGLKLPSRRITIPDEEDGELKNAWDIDMAQGPPITSITYEDYLALIETREDISAGMTRIEFYNALVNRGEVAQSDINLKWKCTKKKHAWQASYNSVRNGDGCPRCPKAITQKEFDNPIEEETSIKFFNYLSKKNSFKKKLSSVQRDLHQWQSSKAIDLSIVESLAESVKDAYIEGLKKRQKQFTLTFGSPFVTLTNQKLVKRYLNRAKYNYTGIIYKIIDTVTGRYYYGLTTQTLGTRWNSHLNNGKAYRLNLNSLDYFINDLKEKLINQGRNKSQANSIINSRFERIPIEVSFDLLTLLNREKFYISNARKINPAMCFNIAPGGGRMRLVDYIPLNDLIKGLAKGLSLNTIADDLDVSIGAVSKFCKKFWGGYYNSLDLFLKPVVEELIKKGYDRKYIAAVLGGEDNRDRTYKPKHYRFTAETLIKYYKRWWPDCNNWGDIQTKFLKNIFESLVLKGYDYEKMVEELEAFNDKQQLKYRFRKLFKDDRGSGLEAARRILLKPILENLLPQFTDSKIIKILNLKDWLPFGGSNNKISDEKRLLIYLVESIWLHKYMTYRKGMNYELRVQSIYKGDPPTDIVRYFLRTGLFKFLS
jgi:hypothetical protein